MGNPFSTSQTSSQSYTPFTGEQAGWQKNTWDTLNSRFTNPFQNLYGGQTQTQGGNQVMGDALTSAKNQMNNGTMAAFATGQYLDPMSNPYMKGYIDQAMGDFGKMLGKSFDNTNGLFQTRGMPGSSAWYNAQAAAKKQIGDQASQFLTNLGNQAYQQNVGNMMQANNLINSATGQYGTLANAANTIDQRNIQNGLSAWQLQKSLDQQDTGNLLNMLNMSKNPVSENTTESEGGWGPGLLSTGLGIMAKKNKWW